MEDATQAESMAPTELGEAELEILCGFLRETAAQLLAVNKDLLNRELHTPAVLELLKQYAGEKGVRSLVVAKIERPASNAGGDADTSASGQDAGSDTQSSIRQDGNVEISFDTKVQYLGPNAQSLAFLKREDYAKLDLAAGIDLEKVLDAGISADASSGTPAEEHIDLSSQIQVVNLGYLGQDSNLFELASTYVDFSFMPLFQDYKSKTQVANTGADQS